MTLENLNIKTYSTYWHTTDLRQSFMKFSSGKVLFLNVEKKNTYLSTDFLTLLQEMGIDVAYH